MPIQIGKRSIGSGRTYVIAEMAWSHDGSRELAMSIIQGAINSGCDCISLHVTDMPTYMIPHYGSGKGRVSAGKESNRIYDYLCEINLKDEWLSELFAQAHAGGIDVAVMANDHASLKKVEPLKPELYVIPAAAFTEEPFIRAVAEMGKPLLLRVGGATLGEIEAALRVIAGAGNPPVALLHGQQNYPTQIKDTDLMKVTSLQTAFGLPVGLADHVDADDPFSRQLPLMAVGLGAAIIEKHLTHDRSKKGEDHESALDPSELKALVADIRKAEEALGAAAFAPLSESQLAYRLVSRKRIVAARNLPDGQILAASDLACKRCDCGMTAEHLGATLGRRLAKAVVANEGIEASDLL